MGRHASGRVAFDVASALDPLAERDSPHPPATSAAAWPLASVGLLHGRVDRDRNSDSTGAAGTDSHIPSAGIVVGVVDNPRDLREDLRYLGM